MAVNRTRRARAARRRKLRVARAGNDLTAAQWSALKAAWDGCAYCGATQGVMQRDCVMAISRGGRYTLDNVVPACASCNTSKCNDEVTGWMRRKRLDERRFLTRYIEIRSALMRAAEDDERAHIPVGERRVVEQTRPLAGDGREGSAG